MAINNNKYKYKFSIIMSIYNVEKYLKEAVDSIINQDIGFEEHVQLILVNDGSLDNSEKICLEYKEKYPENVVYAKKENGGLASAKNFGLKYREGKYINFFDPDDILTKNTLREVYRFFEKNYEIIPFVAIPIYFFEAKEGLHSKYTTLGKKNKIINLDIEPHNFVLSSASTFYKTELFDEIKFDESFPIAEDAYFNTLILEKNHAFGYVCEREVKYNYRKRFTKSSLLDVNNINPKAFWVDIKFLNEIIGNKKDIPVFIKEIILYELRSRIRDITPKIFEDKDEYLEILEKYRELIEKVGTEHIATVSKMILNEPQKYIFLSNILKNNNVFKLGDNGFIQNNGYNLFPVTNYPFRLAKFKFKKKKIVMELLFSDYNTENIDIIAKNHKGKIYEFKTTEIINSPYDIKYGKFEICPTIRKVLEIPYKKNKISFYFLNKENGKEYKINNIQLMKNSKFILKDKEIRLFHKEFNVRFKKDEIIIKNYKYPSWEYNKHTYTHIKNKYHYRAIFRLLNRRKKKYILVNDRPQKAGDNGEAIFKYINKNEKKLAKNTYFVISNKCNDYKRLKKYGKVVKLNSIKHKLLFLNSKLILSSHLHPLFFNAFKEDELKYYKDMFNYKFVFLQHGIIMNDVSKAVNQYNSGFDYMVVSTDKEREEIAKSKYMIYDEKDLILNGLPRYDYLKNNAKNIITIAPTWRTYLTGSILDTGYHDTIENFEKSEYYIRYINILQDLEINKLLKENNYKLEFLLHPGMIGYAKYFEKYSNDRIKIIKPENINYQKVFEESKLLITDYSSVFFDFAYLKKPIIYYQFDKEDFFTKHYKPGYFDYEKDGLGSVIYDDKEIIQKIKYYFSNGFKMEDKYIERVNKTFKYTDQNNCKRLIDYLRECKVIK